MDSGKFKYGALGISILVSCYCAFVLYNGEGSWSQQQADWLGLAAGMLMTFVALGSIRQEQMEAFDRQAESDREEG